MSVDKKKGDKNSVHKSGKVSAFIFMSCFIATMVGFFDPLLNAFFNSHAYNYHFDLLDKILWELTGPYDKMEYARSKDFWSFTIVAVSLSFILTLLFEIIVYCIPLNENKTEVD